MNKTLIVLIFFLASQYTYSRTIRLQGKSKNICVGKSKTLVKSNIQMSYWSVNGRRSRMSTFWYQGHHARLKLDVDTADVVATCRTVGRQTFSLQFQYNNLPNHYTMNYTVNCIPCAARGGVKAHVRKAKRLIHKNKIKMAMHHVNEVFNGVKRKHNNAQMPFEKIKWKKAMVLAKGAKLSLQLWQIEASLTALNELEELLGTPRGEFYF